LKYKTYYKQWKYLEWVNDELTRKEQEIANLKNQSTAKGEIINLKNKINTLTRKCDDWNKLVKEE